MRDLCEEILRDLTPGVADAPAEPAEQWGERMGPAKGESLGDWAVSLLRTRLRR